MKRLVQFILGFNLASLTILFRSGVGCFISACLVAFRSTWSSRRAIEIPEIDLGAILGDRHPEVRLQVQQYQDGMLPSEDAMALAAILMAEAPKEVLEIGTYMGHTTRLMAENLASGLIHTVDLPETFTPQTDPNTGLPKDDYHLIAHRRVGCEYKGQPCESRIRQHFGDSATWDFRQAGAPTFFFIDGSHTYEYCTSDTEKSLAIAGPSSVFLWHDVDSVHEGVIRSLVGFRKQGKDIRRIRGTAPAYWKRS